jgi:hypothetical protein
MTTKKKKVEPPFCGLATDYTQTTFKISTPEIRVWCHPHRVGKVNQNDYYRIFESFTQAMLFIAKHKKIAEEVPLIAFHGYEINLWTLKAPEIKQ